MAVSQEAQNLARASANIKKTAKFAKLGKALFSNQNLRLSPAMVTSLMREAGIPIPKDVQIGVQVAQIIVSGGAFIAALETADTISGYAAPGISTIQASIELMSLMGWVDKDDPAVKYLTLGVDVAAVVAAHGTDVMADIKLGLDVYLDAQTPNAEPYAQMELSKQIKGRRKTQIDALTKNMADYTAGKYSIFGFMGKVAEESPDYFSNYFPNMEFFFPPGYMTYITSATTHNLFGSSETAYASQRVNTLFNTSHSFVESTIWTKIILPSFSEFKRLADTQKRLNRISVQSLAILSLLPPYIKIFAPDFNAINFMKNFSITPNDLEENPIDDFLRSKIDRENLTAPITMNGIDYYTPYQKEKRALNAKELKLLTADANGDIFSLMQDSETLKHLNDWGTPAWSADLGVMGFNPQGSGGAPTLSMINFKTTSSDMMTAPQRGFWNYFSALSILEKVRTDQYFSDMENVIRDYDILGKIKDLEDRHKKLIVKISCRILNGQAIQNIASWMGTTPKNLALVQKGTEGKPAIFGYKQ
jgi:hypothetical protein